MKLTKKLVGAYSYAFNTPEGKQVLDDLKMVSGFEEFTETNEPCDMAYQNGKRDMYLYIATMLEGAK